MEVRDRDREAVQGSEIYKELKQGEDEERSEREAIQEEEPRRLLLTKGEGFMQAPREIGAKLIPRLGGRRGGKLGLYGPGGSGKTYTFLNLAVGAATGVTE